MFQTLTKFCHSFGHLEVYMADTFWHLILASIWHSFWHLFRHHIWHPILAFYLAFILALILASYLTFCSGILPGIYSDTFSDMGTAGPQPRAPDLSGRSQLRPGSAHCDLALAVEFRLWLELPVDVRQCPLRSGARGWSPAVPTEIWSLQGSGVPTELRRSRLRPGSAHCDPELVLRSAVPTRGWRLALPSEPWHSQLRPSRPLISGVRSWGPAVPTEIRSGQMGGGGSGLQRRRRKEQVTLIKI